MATPAQPVGMPINIGIPEDQRQDIADGLSRLLADTYTLYLKTHNYHWNVTGPMFNTLHLMFETQYNELALAVDEIAERIRALGFADAGQLRLLCRIVFDPGGHRCSGCRGYDPTTRRRAGDGRAHCAGSFSGRRGGQ